jgi:uncharacterized membrane protein YphA (DoxX/SURF4 family)
MTAPLPMSIVYAGLVGVVIALVVATAQQKWKPKVFFLLALRLAIGWQFLFEGLHKIHSHYVGPTETNVPFASNKYFETAPGPLAPYMRAMDRDAAKVIAERMTPKQELPSNEFAKLSESEQAALCPDAVAKELADFAATVGQDGVAEKAAFARWVYGVDRRAINMTRINGEPAFTGPQRLKYLALLRKELNDFAERSRLGLGNGTGTDVKKAQTARTEFLTAEKDLASETDAFLLELKTAMNRGKAPEKTTTESMTQFNDRVTRWFLAIVGAGLLFGVFTRISCVLAAGFLLLTYLTHPPFPWFALPPGTEGNPLFINKNAIEFFALLALACMPTGKWLGLDAMIAYVFRRKPATQPALATTV